MHIYSLTVYYVAYSCQCQCLKKYNIYNYFDIWSNQHRSENLGMVWVPSSQIQLKLWKWMISLISDTISSFSLLRVLMVSEYISDKYKLQLAPSTKSHKLWCKVRVLHLPVSLMGKMLVFMCYFKSCGSIKISICGGYIFFFGGFWQTSYPSFRTVWCTKEDSRYAWNGWPVMN